MKLKETHRLELEQLHLELKEAQGQITGKDLYISELEKQNDDFQSKIERVGFETFRKIQDDFFAEDQETDRLIGLRKYVDVYDKFELEVADMVAKYQQQEKLIMSLKQENYNLCIELKQYEFNRSSTNSVAIDNMSAGGSQGNRSVETVATHKPLDH